MSESVFVQKSEIKKIYDFFKDKKLLCPEAYKARTLNLGDRERQRERDTDRKRETEREYKRFHQITFFEQKINTV
jgi:hypothetical protein